MCRITLEGLSCQDSSAASHSRAVGAGDPCRCGWPGPHVGPLCWSHLPQPPSEQYRAMAFHDCSAPAILLLPLGHGVPCRVENAVPWRACKQRLLPALCRGGEHPGAAGCEAARASERAAGSGAGAVAGAEPGEMLSPAFEESAQGLCVCSAFGCQLWFASPQSRFSLACSGARPGEGAGGFGLLGYL